MATKSWQRHEELRASESDLWRQRITKSWLQQKAGSNIILEVEEDGIRTLSDKELVVTKRRAGEDTKSRRQYSSTVAAWAAAAWYRRKELATSLVSGDGQPDSRVPWLDHFRLRGLRFQSKVLAFSVDCGGRRCQRSSTAPAFSSEPKPLN